MKAFSRKILVISLALAMIFGSCLNAYADTKTYKGKTGDTSILATDFNFNLKLDYSWFIAGDNTVYSQDLAKLACVACNACYGTGTAKLLGKTRGNNRGFLIDIGFNDVEFNEIGSTNGYDEDDTSAILIGHKKYTYNNRKYEIIFVAVRGSVTISDWKSNFDIGYDCDEYYEETGEHPEWTNKDHHKGFDVAANRVYNSIEKYISKNTDSSCEKVYFVTGHSRGGAIANIIGTYYEDRNDCKSFTYTIAALSVTTVSHEECESYDTILNLINHDDLVTYSNPEEFGGFKRYGQEYTLTGGDYASEYYSLTGKRYVGDVDEAVRKSYIGTETYTREEMVFGDEEDANYSFLIEKFFDGSIISWHMPAIYYILFDQDLNTSGRSFLPQSSASVFSEPASYIVITAFAVIVITSLALGYKKKKKA